MSSALVLPEAIHDKLSAMARQQRELAAVRGVGEFLLIASLASGACLFADQRWNLAAEWRMGCLVLLAATLILAGWWRLIRPIIRPRSWTELAAAVERQHPELSERLTTLVELQSESSPGRSNLMQDLLARQTVKAVSQVDFTEALPARKSLQRAAFGLLALAVLLLPFLLPGGRYALSWNRLLNPWGNYAWGQRLAFHVVDGDRVVAKGADVTLQAQVEGLDPSEAAAMDVKLHWTDAAGHAQQRTMTWSADEQSFSWTIPRVEQNLRYQLQSRRAVSREYRITAANPPEISRWKIDIQPPAYTGLPAQSLDAVVGELWVPERSRIRLECRFAEPMVSATMLWPEEGGTGDGDTGAQAADEEAAIRIADHEMSLSDDRRSATIERMATVSGPFTVELVSELGLTATSQHELAVIPDAPPEITIDRDESIKTVRPDDVLPVPIAASDDHGLTAVELHWELSLGGAGQRSIPAAEIIGTQFEQTIPLNLAELNLPADQTISFQARAVDNRPIPSPQEAWSQPWEIAVSSQVDSLEQQQLAEAQQSLEQRLDQLEQGIGLQKQAVDEEHRDTARQAVRDDKPPENQEELARLQERQAELLEQLERLRKELDDRPFFQNLAEEHLPELERQLSESQQKLAETAEAKSSREQIEQLSQSLDDLSRAEDQLARLKQQAKALAALEQELAELGQLSRQAEQLADRAERLEIDSKAANPQAKNEDANDPAATSEELDSLRQETGELTEHLDDLLRRRPELLEAARQNELERLDRLADMARRLAESQDQLANAMNSPPQTAEQNAAENSAKADTPPNEPAGNLPDPGNDSTNSSEPAGENAADQLSERIQRATRRQQQLAREAASQMQQAAESAAGNESPETSPESATPSEQFAEQAREAARSAQLGDLQRAAEQSRQAGESARAAARENDSPPPDDVDRQQANDLAQRQSEVAEELSRLAQSAEARQTAQEQGQKRLSQAAEALTEALQQSAERMSQQPLNQSEPSRAAEEASRAAAKACECMGGGAGSLRQGNSAQAAQQANSASEQLKQAAQQVSQAAGGKPESSSQGRAIPGESAGRVAEAAANLQQAQGNLAQAGENSRPQPANSPAAANEPGSSPAETPPASNSENSSVESSSKPGETANGQPSTPSPQKAGESPSPLHQSAAQLRQAAEAMAAASAGLRSRARNGKPDSRGKPSSPGQPGDSSPASSEMAGEGEASPAEEPGDVSKPTEGKTMFSAGSHAVGDKFDQLTEISKPAGASRNWGRLPKHLQTEMRQGAAKKPHPEYSRQIKRYFERIAQPAERSRP